MSVPPVARGVICVDFDGTLFPWAALDDDSDPFPGAVRAVKAFAKAGYRIIIFTSRASHTWHLDEVNRLFERNADFMPSLSAFSGMQLAHVERRLRKHDIPFDRITAEKVPAEYYIDDRAMEFRGDWNEIHDRVLGGPR